MHHVKPIICMRLNTRLAKAKSKKIYLRKRVGGEVLLVSITGYTNTFLSEYIILVVVVKRCNNRKNGIFFFFNYKNSIRIDKKVPARD